MARTAAFTNENLKPSVAASQTSFTIDDDSAIAASEPYVTLALSTSGEANLHAHNLSYGGGGDTGLVLDSASNLWFVSTLHKFANTPPTVNVIRDTTPDGTLLRAVFVGHSHPDRTLIKFVTDNGGAGNTFFETSDGLKWLVEDVDATTTPGFQVKYDESSGTFVINAGSITQVSTFYAIEPYTGNALEILNSSSTSVDVYIDPADAVTDRLNANFVAVGNRTATLLDFADAGQVWAPGTQFVQIYVNPNASAENRLQHEFAFVPAKIYIQSKTTNQFLPIAYNANASSDGYPLRMTGGSPFYSFDYNNTSTGTDINTSVSTASDVRPSQETKA